MKSKITEEIKEIFSQSVNWAKLEIEYLKLTAAEKIIMLLSVIILGGIMMLLLLPVMLMFLFALAQVFVEFMPVALAYVTVGGIVLLLLAILFIFRKALIINPVARLISKLILEREENEKK